MSYRGRPSKGCEKCKTRKVKCDEARPACGRCTKSGHQCNYVDPGDLLFRNQNDATAKKAEDSWRKRAKPKPDSERNTSTTIVPESSKQASSSENTPQPQQGGIPSLAVDASTSLIDFGALSLMREPATDLRRLAYDRFVYDFVSLGDPAKSTEESGSVWSFIHRLYEKSQQGSCLATIVEAAAYLNFASRCNAPEARALGRKCGQNGIKLLRQAISDEETKSADDTLCAVHMIGVYENLNTPEIDGGFRIHGKGAAALLLLRPIDEILDNPISANLLWVTFLHSLINSLVSGTAPTTPVNLLQRGGRDQLVLADSTCMSPAMVQLLHDAVSLHARWFQFKHSTTKPTNRAQLRDLLWTALELEAGYQVVDRSTPQNMRFETLPNSPEIRSGFSPIWRDLILNSPGAPGQVNLFPNFRSAAHWSTFRGSRLYLLRDLLEILNWMLKLPGQQDHEDGFSYTTTGSIALAIDNTALLTHHSSATARLANVINQLHASVAGWLNMPIYNKSYDDIMGMRGYMLLWPLMVEDSVLKGGFIPDMNELDCFESEQRDPVDQPISAANFSFFAKPNNSSESGSFTINSHPDLVSDNQFSMTVPQSADYSPIISVDIADLQALPRHALDIGAPQPFDHTVGMPPHYSSMSDIPRIDILEKRGWIHRILYWIAADLGIRKSLGVVFAEGYMEKSKGEVDAILGRG